MQDENQYKKLEDLAHKEGLEIFKVSAATGLGLKELMNVVAKELKTLPQQDIKEEIEEDVVYTLNHKKDDYTITIQDGVYVVEGEAIEKILRRINMEDNESLYYFQKCIRNLGVEDKLKAMGIKEGDTVKFVIWEFEWYNS